VARAKENVDLVIGELKQAGAFDRIFAFEIGNEFVAWGDPTPLESFIDTVAAYIRQRARQIGGSGVSNWVTWASWPPSDPLYTDGVPVLPRSLDYYSFNAYSYDPERMRDHQAGPVTGTPYQGYLAALKARCMDKPLVISETGLPDSTRAVGLDQAALHPWYSMYRRGALTQEQIAEGLEDRFWDACLLGSHDPNILIAGMSIFEWCDEFHKVGNPAQQDDDPEEHFGLATFRKSNDGYDLRYKLQQDTVQRLYTLDFAGTSSNSLEVWPDANVLSPGSSTRLHSAFSSDPNSTARILRWETNRGFISGTGPDVEFHAGPDFFGPIRVTAVAVDANGTVCTSATRIDIETGTPPAIEIITYGQGKDFSDSSVRASGRVRNVDLDRYKLVVYIKTDKFYVQPYQGMKSIWIGPTGYWWTKLTNSRTVQNSLYCWIVPQSFDPPNTVIDKKAVPFIAEATVVGMTTGSYADSDYDLLPDVWEQRYFGSISKYDRYDDPDKDGADNLEEYLASTSPVNPNDNDIDTDSLMDNWERRFFGSLEYGANDDLDGDGLDNLTEQTLGIHPCRTAVDRDRDTLPDAWEADCLGGLAFGPQDDPDGNGISNIDEYELGLAP
jgi:hypothetical protein